jgi:hypothetical protein
MSSTEADFSSSEDEDIPDTLEETEELEEESPGAVLERVAEDTGVHVFDRLKADVWAWTRGELSPDEVMGQWYAWDQDLGARHHYFEEGLRFQEWTEEFVPQGREVFEQYEWIQEQMGRLQGALALSDQLEAAYAVEQMHLCVVCLRDVYARLQAAAAAAPRLSESPLVAELIRVGQLVAEQKIPVEAFAERLAVFCDLHEQMRLTLSVMPAAPRERNVLREEQQALDNAFSEHDQGVTELQLFVETGERGYLDRGLELLESAAHGLNRVRLRLTGAIATAEALPCPHCGALNPRALKICGACQARLPDVADEVLEAALGGLSPAEQMPSNLKRLGDAVQQTLAGQMSRRQFAEHVAWFRGLQQRAQQQLDNLRAPAPGTPAEQAALLNEARGASGEGLETVELGLQMFEDYLAQQVDEVTDRDLLSRGWEMVLRGSERLQELESMFQQALQMSVSSS